MRGKGGEVMPYNNMGGMLDHALAYAAAGYPVLPLKVRDKEPACAHGKDDATLDPARIRHWWGRNPDYNIGIRPPAGFVVIDEDTQHGGDAELAELTFRHGDLPATWIARTGNGGRHIWLRAEPPFRGKLCPGVDIKHHSGYLVAPPSIHPNGNRYQWLTNLPIAQAPDWLRPMLAPDPPRPAPTPGWRCSGGDGSALVRFVANALDGNGNNSLFWAVRRAVESGVIDQIRDDLKAAAVAAGQPERKVEATIRSGIANAQKDHR